MSGLHGPHPRQTIHSIAHSQAVCLGEVGEKRIIRSGIGPRSNMMPGRKKMHARIVQVMLTAVGFIASLSLSTGIHAAVANGLIAYPCETENPPETHQQNICLIDPAAPNPAATRKQITFDGINALPAWSPDGTM